MGGVKAAGLGRFLSEVTGGQLEGKKTALAAEGEEAKLAEDTRRFDEEMDLKKQTLAHTEFMDKLQFDQGLSKDQADTYLAAIGRAMEMIKQGAEPKAVEQWYNMFANKYGFDEISGMQVDPKTGNYSFTMVGGKVFRINKSDGSIEETKETYTPDSVLSGQERTKAASVVKPSDITGHMNQILKEYGATGDVVAIKKGGGFVIEEGGATSYAAMRKAANAGDMRALGNLKLYNELKSDLEVATTGSTGGTLSALMGPGGVFGGEDFQADVKRYTDGGSAPRDAIAKSFIVYYMEQGMERAQAVTAAQEAMKSMGISDSE